MEQSSSPLLTILISMCLVVSQLPMKDLSHTIIYSVIGGVIGWSTHQVLNRLKKYLPAIKGYFKTRIQNFTNKN